jgi:DNA-binding Xre family transcriptional regulator
MKRNRIVRGSPRTSKEIERDAAIRRKYQTNKPSLEQIRADSDYTEPVPQGECLTLMGFAAAIRAIRQQLKLSLTDIAEISGIDKAQLSRLESGQAENPTYSTLDRIATALNKRLRLVLDDNPVGAK